MKNLKLLPTGNKDWGFWGTSMRNGYDVKMAWDAVSKFLSKNFELTPEQVCDVMDSKFGRHLADDLSMINGGLTSAQIINNHLTVRVLDQGWHDCFEKAIKDVTGKIYPRKAPITKDKLLTQIAQHHLNVETLVERKSDSLDFYDVSVWGIKDALEAAYKAGHNSK